MNHSLPLALCLGLACAGASLASDDRNNNNLISPQRTAVASVSVDELQRQNAFLQTQMDQMQAMFESLALQMAKQKTDIEQVADPRAVEKATVREVLEILHIPTDDLSDDESGDDKPPLNYNFIYVQNKPALLARLKKLAATPWANEVVSKSVYARISELEEELGITAARHEEEKKKLKEERRREEEELRRRMEMAHQEELQAVYKTIAAKTEELQRQVRVLTDKKKRLKTGYISKDASLQRSYAKNEELQRKIQELQASQQEKTAYKPQYNYN